MGDPTRSKRDALPDHGGPDGTALAFSYDIVVTGLDGKAIPSMTMRLMVLASGQVGVAGPTGDLGLCLDILDNVRDAIAGYHTPSPRLVVPGKDVSIQGVSVGSVMIDGIGPIWDNRDYGLALIDSAKKAVRDLHARRALVAGGITTAGSIIEL